ncbi:hypothetical protein FMUND_6412 [Fusarium mundagurra]|uniref:PINIT domain-containing protein n=1 Tax=Fusarium mundagurra TaxID=1567541 RepID=A0A8H6DGZ0_9HYPO|nr:hypothetical protein FMUND_6412 [Fusarium mundagurra]
MASAGFGPATAAPSHSTNAHANLRSEASSLARQVNRLLNRQLSSVCQVNGVKSTGIKAELQRRIHNLSYITNHVASPPVIQEAVNANDPVRLQQIRQSVHNSISSSQTGSSPSRSNYPISHGHASSTPFGLHGMSFPSTHGSLSNGQRSVVNFSSSVSLTFKPSPFYQIEAVAGDIKTCDVMSQHRNTITYPIRLDDHPALQKCVNDPSYRVMVFCAGDTLGIQDVAFPHQSELKVNGGEVKANLRGLKNKPGSTRPVDITKALRLRPKYTNNVEFTYALTSKNFYLVINVCKITSVEQLAERIANGKKISIDSVKQELNAKAQDPDVHSLVLQEQGPQWQCPICNKSATFEQLAVDAYVKDILEKTPKSQETVTIEPNGEWHLKSTDDSSQGHTNGNSSYANAFDDDDDDLVISEVNSIGHRRLETPKISTPISTPVTAGRDVSSSAGPRGIASTSAKRPIAAVIDLTLSDDDDDDPPPPPKRQNTSMNGYSGNLPNNSPISPGDLGYL